MNTGTRGVREQLPHPLRITASAGYRWGEDVGYAHPFGVAGLAGNRGEDQDPGLLHLQRLLDQTLGVRGLGAEVDLRTLDPHVDALDRLAALSEMDLQGRLAAHEQLLRGHLADRD